MGLRRIAGIVGLVAALLLSFSAVSKGWFTASHRDESMGIGPLWVEECEDGECESELLMKEAHGNAFEVFAAAGIGFAGLASITSLLLLIFGILAVTNHGGKATGITSLVFVVLTNIGAGAFAGLKPPDLSMFSSSLGLFLSSFGGMAGIAFGIMMIVAARKSAQPVPLAYGAPPGYGGPPPGYAPQPGMQPGYPAAPQQGYPPPQGYPAAPQQGYPAAPQQGYPAAPQQGYPAAPQQGAPPPQGYPAAPQQGYPPAAPPPTPPGPPGQGYPPTGQQR